MFIGKPIGRSTMIFNVHIIAKTLERERERTEKDTAGAREQEKRGGRELDGAKAKEKEKVRARERASK